jgi:hypothetical protein
MAVPAMRLVRVDAGEAEESRKAVTIGVTIWQISQYT